MLTTEHKDDTHLVPLLKSMERIRDVESLKQKAEEFLSQCRFAGDKIAVHQRKLQQMTDPATIHKLCWNVLLSGEGQKVIRAH